MLRYFDFLFHKRRLFRMSILLLSFVAILSIAFATGIRKGHWEISLDASSLAPSLGYKYSSILNSNIFYVYGIVFMVLCAVEPMIIFAFKMDRNSFETERILPVTKKNLCLSRFFLGYLEIAFPYLFACLFSALIILGQVGAWNYYGYATLFFLILIGLGIFAYAYFTFFFIKARNLIDGAVLIILSAIALFLLGNAVSTIVKAFASIQVLGFEYHLNPLALVEWYIGILANKVNSTNLSINTYLIYLPCMIVLGALALVCIIFSDRDFKVENAKQKTVSKLGYKLLIPLVCITMLVSKSLVGEMIYYLMPAISLSLTYLLYALSYRRFVFNKKEWFIFLAVSLAEVVVYLIGLFLL